MKAVVTDYDIITPFGCGTTPCWEGLLAGRSAIAELKRFDTAAFQSAVAGTIPDLSYHQGPSLVWQSFQRLAERAAGRIPSDARLILATTTGEVDLLERALLSGESVERAGSLDGTLRKTRDLFRLSNAGTLVSSACASSTAAIAIGAAAIRDGECDCALVVACDAVTEFVFSGFSSLQALDPQGARPFDAGRRGLSVGEGAGWMLLMSAERAEREHAEGLGRVAGWGMSNDANHMTGPARNGDGLARAIRAALRSAGCRQNEIGFICAHGTGTVYNDSMEMMAFDSLFDMPRPIFSVKGGIGHTMGAAGLIEAVLTFKALHENQIPPTVRLQVPDDLAVDWAAHDGLELPTEIALTTNSGFGGVNAALTLCTAARGAA